MNLPSDSTLVIVDGYSSGSALPSVVSHYGWKCVHVRNLPNPPPLYLTTFRRDDYVDQFSFDGDVLDLARAVGRVRPSAVLPGTESGVVVADQLAAALGLPGNDPSTSTARRNKYEMIERITAHGLRGPEHYLADEVNGLLAWSMTGSWPVVVKPPASAGTDSVLFCQDPTALEAGFRRVFGSTNQLGERNGSVLAQRMLTGREYFVNGLSGFGHHVITEIWRADKIRVHGASVIYDLSILIDPSEPAMQPVVAYVCRVLDALGVRYGASHTEIMDTDDGLTLIECASRLSGGINRPALSHAVGASQIDLLGNLAVEGEAFMDRLAHMPMPVQHSLWNVAFVSNRSGVVSEVRTDDLLAALHSKAWIHKAPRSGDRLERTTDLFTSPGHIYLSHPNPDVLLADYRTIREWEKNGRLFVVSN